MLTLYPDTSCLVHIMFNPRDESNWWKLVEHTAIFPSGMAHAERITGGRLTSLKINPKLIEIAPQNVGESGLVDMVEFVQEMLERHRHYKTPFDLVLLDCRE